MLDHRTTTEPVNPRVVQSSAGYIVHALDKLDAGIAMLLNDKGFEAFMEQDHDTQHHYFQALLELLQPAYSEALQLQKAADAAVGD